MKYQDYNILLEYSGNEKDNGRFAVTMQNFEKLFRKYYLYCDLVIADTINFFTDTKKYKAIKTCDSFQKFLNSCYKKAEESNAKLSQAYKDLDFDIKSNYQEFDKLVKKFSVKYSTVTLGDKKEYYKLFKKNLYEIIDLYNKNFTNEWINKLNTELKKLAEIDTDKEVRLVSLVNTWLKAFYDFIGYHVNNIRYVIYKMNPDIEHTLTFKIVQRFLKK